ncbi:hypothetical protein H4582DRAFT_2062366 [Lactarius indigo]|nr:hypothetical protein H4582DRAFT_2062366 [Lactarius indigo]
MPPRPPPSRVQSGQHSTEGDPSGHGPPLSTISSGHPSEPGQATPSSTVEAQPSTRYHFLKKRSPATAVPPATIETSVAPSLPSPVNTTDVSATILVEPTESDPSPPTHHARRTTFLHRRKATLRQDTTPDAPASETEPATDPLRVTPVPHAAGPSCELQEATDPEIADVLDIAQSITTSTLGIAAVSDGSQETARSPGTAPTMQESHGSTGPAEEGAGDILQEVVHTEPILHEDDVTDRPEAVTVLDRSQVHEALELPDSPIQERSAMPIPIDIQDVTAPPTARVPDSPRSVEGSHSGEKMDTNSSPPEEEIISIPESNLIPVAYVARAPYPHVASGCHFPAAYRGLLSLDPSDHSGDLMERCTILMGVIMDLYSDISYIRDGIYKTSGRDK